MLLFLLFLFLYLCDDDDDDDVFVCVCVCVTVVLFWNIFFYLDIFFTPFALIFIKCQMLRVQIIIISTFFDTKKLDDKNDISL